MTKNNSCPDISDDLPLTRVFRNPSSKILDFLILNKKFDYSEAEISIQAVVPSRTLQRVLPCLVDEKLVVKTRRSGRTNMYVANLDSKRLLALQDYVKATIEENLKNPEVFDKPQSITQKNTKLFES